MPYLVRVALRMSPDIT